MEDLKEKLRNDIRNLILDFINESGEIIITIDAYTTFVESIMGEKSLVSISVDIDVTN